MIVNCQLSIINCQISIINYYQLPTNDKHKIGYITSVFFQEDNVGDEGMYVPLTSVNLGECRLICALKRLPPTSTSKFEPKI
ncbi:hypothetical protein DERF_000815 [Dermatophagoides farinae]|uniref:Uncharacterized protein n=1 Tax=Dermatophagoides farinae TaxID=6954 RepID=A0A922I9M7_DERFA|nr:hypothetical protein DERF_000815 [Dermatophagoides farinae]